MDQAAHMYYWVTPKPIMQYLRFFLHFCLDWEPHVTIMCNRARASLKALQVLGNTHRGLSMANWHLVFNAVCLPVLSYGCQLWATSHKYKSLCARAQLVFNEGVCLISGAFRTAPQEPLHVLTQVLPARHFFDKLTHTSALRLTQVPATLQLLAHLSPDWHCAPGGGGRFCCMRQPSPSTGGTPLTTAPVPHCLGGSRCAGPV